MNKDNLKPEVLIITDEDTFYLRESTYKKCLREE